MNFLRNSCSVVDSASVNPNRIKTLLPSSLITFFPNGKPTFIKGLRTLPKNPPYCIILENCACNNFVLEGNFFAKSWESLVTGLSVRELPILFDNNFQVTSVKIFIGNFNLLSS